MRPFIIYPYSLLLKNSSNSSHKNREHERSTESLPSWFPIHFLMVKPYGWSPSRCRRAFPVIYPWYSCQKCYLKNYFLLTLIMLWASSLTAHKRVQRLCRTFFFPFSLSNTCASLCIYRVVPYRLEDITACTVGTEANRYKMGVIVCLCALMLPIWPSDKACGTGGVRIK